MVSKSRLQFYASLRERKARAESGLFLAEGHKIVREGLESGCPCEALFVREGSFGSDPETDRLLSSREVTVLPAAEFRRLAETDSPQGVLGVFGFRGLLLEAPSERRLVALEGLADPRNLGSIVRSADWFGLPEIIVGEGCVDLFNGKTVRSAMGSLFHCRFLLTRELRAELSALKPAYRVVTADLGGLDYRKRRRGGAAVFVFSNEARGPSEELLALSDEIITIPGRGGAESLNVSSAAAVIMADIEGGE